MTPWMSGELGVWEVSYVQSDFSGIERFEDIVIVNESAAREVHDFHAVFHLGDGFLVDQAACGIEQRQMEGDEVGIRKQIFEICLVLYPAGEFQSGFNGKVRVIAHNVHIEMERGVGQLASDGAKTDDTEFLSGDFVAGVFLFLLFYVFGKRFAAGPVLTHSIP